MNKKKIDKVKEEIAIYQNNLKQSSKGFLTISSPIAELWDNKEDEIWNKL